MRLDDPRLFRGQARYVDDLRVPGTLHVAFARSIYPHARFRVDAMAARALPAVASVFTAADLEAERGFRDIPAIIDHPSLKPCRQLPLARGKVRYVGEPIAAVVAESRYAAQDGAEAMQIAYDPLDPIAGAHAAVAGGAPLLHDSIDGNVAADFTVRSGDAEAAFRRRDRDARALLRA